MEVDMMNVYMSLRNNLTIILCNAKWLDDVVYFQICGMNKWLRFCCVLV